MGHIYALYRYSHIIYYLYLHIFHANFSVFVSLKDREASLVRWEQRFSNDKVDMKAKLDARREQLRVATLRHEELQKLVKTIEIGLLTK